MTKNMAGGFFFSSGGHTIPYLPPKGETRANVCVYYFKGALLLDVMLKVRCSSMIDCM